MLVSPKPTTRKGGIDLMANVCIELHDSEVSEITCNGRSLHVAFNPGYVHQSDGVPGKDAGWGYLQSVDFDLSDACCTTEGVCLGRIADGWMRTKTAMFENLIPLPFAAREPLHLTLQFESGGKLECSATAISCQAIGAIDPDFKEPFTL